jgi:hypothetical protein
MIYKSILWHFIIFIIYKMIYKNVGDSIFFINIKSYYFYVIEYLLIVPEDTCMSTQIVKIPINLNRIAIIIKL